MLGAYIDSIISIGNKISNESQAPSGFERACKTIRRIKRNSGTAIAHGEYSNAIDGDK